MSTTELLDIVVVPVALALIALAWPTIQNGHRSRIFTRLIFRELEEIGPYPKTAVKDHWGNHLAKRLTHRQIFAHVSENRDFILCLDPDLVYYLTQLWDAYDTRNEKQWLHYLKTLAEFKKKPELQTVHQEWTQLIADYQPAKSGV